MEKMFKNITVEKNGKEYFGQLYVDFEPEYEDTRFDAYNLMGGLSTYGSPSVAVDVRITSATLFPIKGSEIVFDEYEANEEFGYLKDILLDTASGEDY